MPYNTTPIPNPLTYHSAVNDYGLTPGGLFAYRHETWGNWELRFVRSTAASIAAVTAGMVAIKVAAGNTTVTADSTAGDGNTGTPAAGVFLAGTVAEPILPGEYHFVLTKGFHGAVQTDAGAAFVSGDLVVPGATDGKATQLPAATAITSALAATILGTARAAEAAGNVGVDVGVPYQL